MTKQPPMSEPIQSASPTGTTVPQDRAPAASEGGTALTRSLLAGLLRLTADEGLPIRFQARGGSMRPCIRDGDTITISPLPRTVPRFGEVVAFLHPLSSQVIVHRVIRREGGRFWTQGDSVGEGEGPMEPRHLLGGVSKLERAGRPRRLGLGPERVLIAAVTRTPWLFRPLRSTRRWFLTVFGGRSSAAAAGRGSAKNSNNP